MSCHGLKFVSLKGDIQHLEEGLNSFSTKSKKPLPMLLVYAMRRTDTRSGDKRTIPSAVSVRSFTNLLF
jgi:hypothetical protein